MPSQLGDFCKDFGAEGVPVIKIGDVTGGDRIDYTAMQCVSLENAAQTMRFRPEAGDTLIAMTGANVGKTSRVRADDPEGRINQRVGRFVLVDEQGYSKDYVYFLVSSQAAFNYFSNTAYGSAQPNISAALIEKLPVPDIGHEEANRIGSILGALDDKFDLNRRINETLEGIARAIFKDWFVDFGPTRAKMEGRSPYLAPELWGLFPARFNDQGKPEGWERLLLENIGHQCKGSVSPSEEPTRIFEHYSLPAFDSGQEPALDLGITIKSNKTPIPSEVVLLSKLNPEIPRVWIPNDSPRDTPQVASTEFLIFAPKAPAGRSLLYCLFRDLSFKRMLEGMVTGTSKSHQRISPPALLKSNVLLGSKTTLEAFEKAASPLLSRLLSNRAESRTLRSTRDLLLPKLMSGQIRVKQAEQVVEAAL